MTPRATGKSQAPKLIDPDFVEQNGMISAIPPIAYELRAVAADPKNRAQTPAVINGRQTLQHESEAG